jgi:hypothetical protein
MLNELWRKQDKASSHCVWKWMMITGWKKPLYVVWVPASAHHFGITEGIGCATQTAGSGILLSCCFKVWLISSFSIVLSTDPIPSWHPRPKSNDLSLRVHHREVCCNEVIHHRAENFQLCVSSSMAAMTHKKKSCGSKFGDLKRKSVWAAPITYCVMLELVLFWTCVYRAMQEVQVETFWFINSGLWDVTLCHWVSGSWHFKGSECCCHQGSSLTLK